jgi:peptidoglycan/xylan/chitin deacetylase (PgdA/CDA1 family)
MAIIQTFKRIVRRAFSSSLFAPLARTPLLGTITRVSTRKPLVALTFDDGPDPASTPDVLTLLDRYDAKATFFMVGKRAAAHPDIVQAVHDAGHAIGNHTWSHDSLRFASPSKGYKQVRLCKQVLTSYDSRLMRPPYGEQSLTSRLIAALLGYQVILWTRDVHDWREDNVDQIRDGLIQAARPGSIILLHDSICTNKDVPVVRDRDTMLEGLEDFLDQHGDKYRFVTLPELIRRGTALYERHGW